MKAERVDDIKVLNAPFTAYCVATSQRICGCTVSTEQPRVTGHCSASHGEFRDGQNRGAVVEDRWCLSGLRRRRMVNTRRVWQQRSCGDMESKKMM